MLLPFAQAHRERPPPARPWIMWQEWRDLLFAHWPVPPEALRPLLPPPLELDTIGGQAWVGIVPFRMTGIRPRFLPAVPWLSAFSELNVRTYVTLDGQPGVFFLSLDAANPVAVRLARFWFRLPYQDAAIHLSERDGWIDFKSTRIATDARFEGRYRPSGKVSLSRPGTLDHWLTERYCMYPVDRRGQVYRGHVHHEAWPLQPARAEIRHNTMTAPFGFALPPCEPRLQFARELKVVVWGLEKI